MQVLSEQELERRKDREELMKLGINPYPAEAFPINVTSEDIHSNYENRKTDYKDIKIAGRLMSRRIMGSGFVWRDSRCFGKTSILHSSR